MYVANRNIIESINVYHFQFRFSVLRLASYSSLVIKAVKMVNGKSLPIL